MKQLAAILLLLSAFAASALDRITATVTFTGGTTNAQTITVNGSARTWVNSVATPSSEIITNGLAGSAATNAARHFASYPVAGVTVFQSATNILLFRATEGTALTITIATGYASTTYTTQSVSEVYTVRVPMSAEVHGRRISNATMVVQGLDSYATASFSQSATALLNHVSLSNSQTMGNKTITNTTYTGGTNTASWITNALFLGGNLSKLSNGVWHAGIISNASSIAGNAGRITNGVFVAPWATNATIHTLTITNGVNYGNAFSSKGSGSNSEQFGSGSLASAEWSLAVGYTASASGLYGLAFGNLSEATGDGSVAIGQGAIASHEGSIAIGGATETTANYQIRLGDGGPSLSVPASGHFSGNLSIGNDWAGFVNALDNGLQFTNGTAAAANPTNGAAVWVASGEIQYRTSAASEGADSTMRLHNRAALVNGSGTDFSHAGTAYARVDFGGQDPEIALPTAGTYLVGVTIALQSGASPNDQFNFKLYNSTAAADVSNSDIRTTDVGTTVEHSCFIQAIVSVLGASTIQLYGQNATAARGGVASARTRITYVRLF